MNVAQQQQHKRLSVYVFTLRRTVCCRPQDFDIHVPVIVGIF